MEVVNDFERREYQVEVLEVAIKTNTILFMPTGSGKTFIAAMLIKHMAKDIEKNYSEGAKRTFFLVNTVALVTQQADRISRILPLVVSRYSGDMGVDLWDQAKWISELETNQIIVMTAQIFLDLLLHDYINFRRVNLIIMDECHHTTHNHAMNQIMDIYRESEINDRPRILGLTATLLNANCKLERIDLEIKTLENNLDSKVITATDEVMVQKYSTNPKEVIKYYPKCDLTQNNNGIEIVKNCTQYLKHIIKIVEVPELLVDTPILGAELIDSKKSFKKKLTNMLLELELQCEQLGLFAAVECALAIIVRLERLKLCCKDDVVPTLLEGIITKLHYLRNRGYAAMKHVDEDKLPLIYSTPKLRALFDVLDNFNSQSVAIVFVERRLTAKVLYYVTSYLAKNNPKFAGLKPDFIVGYNNNPYNDTREVLYTKKLNLTTLKKFNLKETNVLFASNVIEEGIDIRMCNYVIKFDEPLTFRSYIQSKGRARNKESTYIILIPEGDVSIRNNYMLYRNIEEYMKQNLGSGRAISYLQDKPELDDEECGIPTYYADNSRTGAKVTAISSISLINRYCLSLPQDKFCVLTAYWWMKEFENASLQQNLFEVFLQLPVNSPLKQLISGPPQTTKINAKRAAAIEACKMLHQIGELDSNLLPCGKYSTILDSEELFPHWDANELKAGQKIKRTYDKYYSQWENGCQPLPGIPLFLHYIRIKPNYAKPQKSRLAAFYEILENSRNFAILSSKKRPKICDFTMFLNVGEVTVEVLENIEIVKLNRNQINMLHSFHFLLFIDILPLAKRFVIRDLDNLENSYIIVPAIEDRNGEVGIDWKTVREHRTIPEIRPYVDDERRNIVVNEDTHLKKIVIPWYRARDHHTTRYIVTKVCQNEVPDSQFPSTNYRSYSEYFYQRYNQTLLNKVQPLIEVRAISSKLNCLLPRGQRHSGRRNRLDEDDFEETLIPELCYLLEFPSVYMLKATLLPSILHRIHYLLIAEELRQSIACSTKLGMINIPNGYKWEPLKVDSTSLRRENNSKAHCTIEVSDMITSNMNALKEGKFPWKEEDEPSDIERLLNNVDLLAIIHYQKFMDGGIGNAELQKNMRPNNYERNDVLSKLPRANLNILNSTINSIGPQQCDILQVLTSASAADICNYERLETLGDSFLKFIVSLSLFIYYGDKDEGKLTEVKGKIIGNKNLFFVGRKLKLGSLLKVTDFSPSDFEVPSFSIPKEFKNVMKYLKISPIIAYQITLTPTEKTTGLLNVGTRIMINDVLSRSEKLDEVNNANLTIVGLQLVTDKTIADCVEALIGVYLQACGIKGALVLCHWLGILSPKMSQVTKLLIDPPVTARLNAGLDVNCYLLQIDRLEDTLHYKFKDRSFLLQALTHASFQNNITDCYQRLEFLGDAILDFLITSHIYENCGNLSPGMLTDLRSALVNNITFACFSVRYGFHKYLNARANKLNDIIQRFVKHQESRDHKIGSEILFLIEEQNAKVAELVDVPKVLGDIFESIAAAIYLDSGKNLQQVWDVYYNLMKKEIEEFSKNVPKNHIRLLYEKFLSPPPKFGPTKKIPHDEGVLVPLEIIYNGKSTTFHGVGKDKYNAKLAAAKLALRHCYNKCQDHDNSEIKDEFIDNNVIIDSNITSSPL